MLRRRPESEHHRPIKIPLTRGAAFFCDRLENKARMMIHAAAEVTERAVSKKEIKVPVRPDSVFTSHHRSLRPCLQCHRGERHCIAICNRWFVSQAKIPEGGLGEVIKAVAANSDKYLTLELFNQVSSSPLSTAHYRRRPLWFVQGEALDSEVGVALAKVCPRTLHTYVTAQHPERLYSLVSCRL